MKWWRFEFEINDKSIKGILSDYHFQQNLGSKGRRFSIKENLNDSGSEQQPRWEH